MNLHRGTVGSVLQGGREESHGCVMAPSGHGDTTGEVLEKRVVRLPAQEVAENRRGLLMIGVPIRRQGLAHAPVKGGLAARVEEIRGSGWFSGSTGQVAQGAQPVQGLHRRLSGCARSGGPTLLLQGMQRCSHLAAPGAYPRRHAACLMIQEVLGFMRVVLKIVE